MLVFEGGAFLVRATVGVLGALEGRLYGSREEVEGVLSWGGEKGRWSWLEAEKVVEGVRGAGKVEGEAE